MTYLDIEAEVEAIVHNAPIRFARTCNNLGISPNIINGILETSPDMARWLIQRLAGTKADKQAVLDAYDLFLAESGKVVYKLARN